MIHLPKDCQIDQDDVCIFADIPATVFFVVNGIKCFIVPNKERACLHCIKTQGIVTHRIASMGKLVDGINTCDMTGSDGTVLRIFLTDEDVLSNMALAEDHQKMVYFDAVC